MWHQTVPSYHQYPQHGMRLPGVCPSNGRCPPYGMMAYYHAHGICPGCLGHIRPPQSRDSPPHSPHYHYPGYPQPLTIHHPHYNAWHQGFRDGYYARYGYQARPAESYQNYPPREASDGNYYPYPLPTISASYSTRTDHAYQPYPNLPISPEAESAYRRFVTDTPPLEPTVSPAPELSPRNNGRESWYSTTPTTGIPADEEWGYPCAASDTDNEAQATDAAASTPRSNMSTLSIESTLRRTRLDDVDDDNEQDNVRHDDETEPRIAFTRGGDILLIGEAWQVPDRAAALRDAGPLTGSHEVRSVHESVNEHGEPSPTDVIEPCCEGDLTMAGGLLF